nr:ribonuclease III [Desulfobulbaceae bacterium]
MNDLQQLIEANASNLSKLQSCLKYNFSDLSLLAKALCHRSFTHENTELNLQDNETLEFLGDAVLDLIISSLLIKTYPDMNEGELSKLRAALVNETHLAKMAKDFELEHCILLGRGEKKSGGNKKASILSSTYEAVLGALFLDSDFNTVCKLAEHHFSKKIGPTHRSLKQADAKSLLQELTQQKHNDTPTYILEKTEGPDHDKTFTVSVFFLGNVLATASAKSKKAAEQKAAELAVSVFNA